MSPITYFKVEDGSLKIASCCFDKQGRQSLAQRELSGVELQPFTPGDDEQFVIDQIIGEASNKGGARTVSFVSRRLRIDWTRQ
jgi:hypothetical protein